MPLIRSWSAFGRTQRSAKLGSRQASTQQKLRQTGTDPKRTVADLFSWLKKNKRKGTTVLSITALTAVRWRSLRWQPV
jgi:hypothetical protein